MVSGLGAVDGLHVDELRHAGVRLGDEHRVRARAACICAMTGISSSGPLPQLPPIASAPQAAQAPRRPARARRPSSCGRGCRTSSSRRGRSPGDDATDALDGGLDLVEVGHRLDPDQVDAAGDRARPPARGRRRRRSRSRACRAERRSRRSARCRRRRARVPPAALTSARARIAAVRFSSSTRSSGRGARGEAGCRRTCWSDDPRPGVEVAALDAPDRPRAGRGSRPRADRRTAGRWRRASCPSRRRP